MPLAPITIYGDSISGDRLRIPCRWIETDVLNAETRTAEFLALNPAE
jgi:hypothetical protein